MDQSNRSALLACLLASCFLAGCGGDTGIESSSDPPVEVVDESESLSTAMTPSRLRRLLGDENAVVESNGGEIVGVSLTRSPVDDLSPLEGLRLRSLMLVDTEVTDLSPLKGMPLREVWVRESPVADLSPIVSDDLEVLDLTSNSTIRDLGPLAGTKLRQLYLNDTNVSDISALAGLPLEQLNLMGTDVTDISPVATLDLDILWLPKTGVTDLSPLEGRSLTSLDVADTPIADLSSIPKIVGLQRLNLIGTKVTDLTPLEGLPLVRLLFTPSNVETGLDVVRAMPTLRELDVEFRNPRRLTPQQFWTRFDAGDFASSSGDGGVP